MAEATTGPAVAINLRRGDAVELLKAPEAVKVFDRFLFYCSAYGGTMRQILRNFLVDTRGATALEYVTIAVLLSIVIIAGSTAIGTKLSTLYYGKLVGNF